jgi:hypothetical protein
MKAEKSMTVTGCSLRARGKRKCAVVRGAINRLESRSRGDCFEKPEIRPSGRRRGPAVQDQAVAESGPARTVNGIAEWYFEYRIIKREAANFPIAGRSRNRDVL